MCAAEGSCCDPSMFLDVNSELAIYAFETLSLGYGSSKPGTTLPKVVRLEDEAWSCFTIVGLWAAPRWMHRQGCLPIPRSETLVYCSWGG